jgi:hypothetical protein
MGLKESARQKGESTKFLQVIGIRSMLDSTMLCKICCRPCTTHTVAITTVHGRLSASNCGTHWCQQQNIYPTPWQSLVSGADNLPHIMVVTSVWCRTFTKNCDSFSCHLFSWSTGIFMAQNGPPQMISPISNTVLTGNKIWTCNDMTHNFKSCAYGKQGLDLKRLTLQWLFRI